MAPTMCMLTIVLLVITQCHAMYFIAQGGVQRCFLEDLPEDTLVVGHYKILNYQRGFQTNDDQSGGGGGVVVTVDDPLTGASLVRHWLVEEDKFAFSVVHGGLHHICFTPLVKYSDGPDYKIDLHLDVGEATEDYEELAKLEHLSAIEVEIRKLLDKVRSVRAEQSYQKSREVEFRDTSESTNSRVMWWAILQVIILVVSGVYQNQHLQSFFRKKKLV